MAKKKTEYQQLEQALLQFGKVRFNIKGGEIWASVVTENQSVYTRTGETKEQAMKALLNSLMNRKEQGREI